MAAGARNWPQDFLIFRAVLSLSLPGFLCCLYSWDVACVEWIAASCDCTFFTLFFYRDVTRCVCRVRLMSRVPCDRRALFISAQSRSIVKNRAFSNESRVCQEESWNNGEAREEEEEIGEASDDTEGESWGETILLLFVSCEINRLFSRWWCMTHFARHVLQRRI